MKKLVFLLISWVMIPGGLLAQNFETDLESKSEILKLEFITGNWEGKGWMMGQDGQKHHFDQTENITFKLDSTAILIEGQGEANGRSRSEEHTSELQSRENLVCRLLLEKKKTVHNPYRHKPSLSGCKVTFLCSRARYRYSRQVPRSTS